MISLAVLVAAVVAAAPQAAAPDRKAPRIVGAAMLDADRDSLADRVRLTYSERIRHVADRDGRYPFAVAGYRVSAVGRASGKALVVALVEQAQPDPAAAPAIRYGRTRSRPVSDRAGNQAASQRFVRTTAHGRQPAAPPAPPASPTPLDADGDGTPDAQDCAPRNAAIHPGAADVPDLGFVDSNCDAIDGAEADAVFVAPNGNDANPGTKARPKREINAAIATVRAGNGRYVLVAFGTYRQVDLRSGISIFGGYDPSSWARRDRFPDGLPLISGSPDGVVASGAKDVVLQHLRIRGLNGGSSLAPDAYGIRAFGNASLTLQRVAVSAGDGLTGSAGTNGRTGERGGAGAPGQDASCDDDAIRLGGKGGTSPAGMTGGYGGTSSEILGKAYPGGEGKDGTRGGTAGSKGNPGTPGGRGDSGENGTPGAPGSGGLSAPARVDLAWVGNPGERGGAGQPGNGGGGGGGGGPQQGATANNAAGNAGGGGGGGGSPGSPGAGGRPGGGSFGVYLFEARIVFEDSSIAAGNGGAGGRGGNGGVGGGGGAGGKGGRVCTSEVGAGGDGGVGGAGGRGGGGGGGAGGPSVGIYRSGTSTALLKGSSKATAGTPGAGGAGGSSGPGGAGKPGEAGIAGPVLTG
jgi:hypothetical protein